MCENHKSLELQRICPIDLCLLIEAKQMGRENSTLIELETLGALLGVFSISMKKYSISNICVFCKMPTQQARSKLR